MCSFMVVRTNSYHFLVLPSRAFIAGAACVCCAEEVTESLTIAQVFVSVSVPWVMLIHRPFTAEDRVQSQVSPYEI
jgi:hypothetical protein